MGREEEEEEEGAGAEEAAGVREEGGRWDLNEGEVGGRIGRGKEEETSLPSLSWRQKAQIPPGLFL